MEGLPTVSCSKSCKYNCLCQEHFESITPDNRLVAWENNQKTTKRMRRHLCNKTHRPDYNLLMNTLDHHRAIQEHRLLMTYAQVPCYFDKYRGNPAFWKMPTQLYKKYDEPQNYFSNMSKLERNVIPSIEYVAVPQEIKPVSLRTPKKKLTECEAYCLKRLDSCTLRTIQPHKPILDNLIIKGKGIKERSSGDILEFFKSEQSFTEFGTYDADSLIKADTEIPKSDSLCYLIINDKKVMSDFNGSVITNVIFNGDNSNLETQSHYLFIENKSHVSLRISFQETIPVKTFSSTRKRSNKVPKFFFNRNYKILQMGQKCNIPFWFKSQTSGYFEYLLKMVLVPDLWRNQLEIFVTLKASVSDNDNTAKCLALECMIQNRMRTRLIDECLNHMLKAIPQPKTSLKLYTYDKATIFEALNSTYDPLHRTTKYLYDKKIVDELEAFYESVRLPNHAEIWTLNLNDLRAVTKDREAFSKAKSLEDSLAGILQTIQDNKNARSEALLKLEKMRDSGAIPEKARKGGKSDKSNKSMEKKKEETGSPGGKKGKGGKKTPNEEPVRQPMPETLSGHLENIIAKLSSPSTIKNEQSERLKACYNLLCGYMDKICSDIKIMSLNNFSVRPDPRVTHQIVNINPARIATEQLASCDKDEQRLFDFVTPNKDTKPQPPWSVDLSMAEYEKRFESFHSVLPGAKRNGSAKTGSKKSDGTSFKSKSAGLNSKQESLQINTKPISNPEITNNLLEVDDNSQEEQFIIPENKHDHYKNNVFILFYSNLCDFIDDLEAVLDILPSAELPHDVLQRTNLSQLPQFNEDKLLSVEVVNVRQKISEVLKWSVPEERAEPLVAREYKLQPIPLQAMRRSSSVWEVMKAYYPAKPLMEPKEEGDVFVRIMTSPQKMEDEGTDITPEEVITDRYVQTSLCSNVTASFSGSSITTDVKAAVCLCDEVDRRPCNMEKYVSSIHNSECFKSSELSDSSPDISSVDD